MLLTPEELKPFRNRSTQSAALDYMVSVASNVFIPTYYGNMAKVVEGHRRYCFCLPLCFCPISDRFYLNSFAETRGEHEWMHDFNCGFLVNRYMGFQKTIILDHKGIVNLVDQYMNKTINWENFSIAIQQSHQNRMGIPTVREVIPGQPKEEDYFYANPQECLCPESYRNQLPISSS